MATTIAIPELSLKKHQLPTDIERHPMTTRRIRGIERNVSGLYKTEDLLRMYLLHPELCMRTQFICMHL
jgi:hypothetical protein